MGSRLRGNDAAVPRPAPYVQQSRTIARTFAPVTGDPYKSLFQRDKWIPAFAGMTVAACPMLDPVRGLLPLGQSVAGHAVDCLGPFLQAGLCKG